MAKKKVIDNSLSLGDKKDILGDLMKEVNKKEGHNVVHFGLPDIEYISTGIDYLDQLMGGGLMAGKMLSLMGPEACLDASTVIGYETRTEEGKRLTKKSTSIENLYRLFHGLKGEKAGSYEREVDKNRVFYVNSITQNNSVFKNLIHDVVLTGEKECYRLTTVSGRTLDCTDLHKFYNGTSYTELKDLDIGDIVYIHNNTRYKGMNKDAEKYFYKCVKNHPYGSIKIISDKYSYKNVKYANLVVEAALNNLSCEEYIQLLNSNTLEELAGKNMKFIDPKKLHVHHIDFHKNNDEIDNLQVLTASEHLKLHAKVNYDKLSFQVVPETIKSIESIGIRNTYDIKCYAPHNNYIANNIVVHNSGKTSLAARMVAAAQKADKKSIWMWLDFENSLYGKDNADKGKGSEAKNSWLETLGVDVSRLAFVHDIETMEKYCDICLKALRNKETIINGYVIDSVGAMMPTGVAYKKIGGNLKEKSMEADTIGLLPRKLAQLLTCSKALLSRHKAPLIAITHMYADISNGGWLIPKGGNAFRHFADLRLSLRCGPKANWPFEEKINDKPVFTGFEQVVTLDKTKNSKSKFVGTQINLPFTYGVGIDEVRFLADKALYDGLIHQAGAYFYLEPDLSTTKPYKEREIKIQGIKKFWAYIKGDDAIKDTLKEKYKDINFFEETSEQLQINNLDTGDEDILKAATETPETE